MTKAAELAKMGEVLTNSQIGGRRNIVINGAMQVAQRATSVTAVGSVEGYLAHDRFNHSVGNTAGRYTLTQTAITDLPSFANCMKLDCTTADTSIAASERLIIKQSFEGQDLQQIKKGTSDAEKLTLSFYVKGNASATYTAEIADNDNTRYIAQEFSVTTSWNRVILTYAADTTGTFDDDNASSMSLNIWLHGGSTFTGGTFSSNTVHTTNNQRLGDNQTSFFDSTDREFFITGIQLEVGSQATPFEHRSFGEELALCQRYYEVTGAGQPAKANSTTGIWCGFQFKTQKRAAPSISLTAANQRFFEFGISNRDTSSGSLVQTYLSTKSCLLRIEGYSGITAGDTYLSGGLVSDTTADTFIAESEL